MYIIKILVQQITLTHAQRILIVCATNINFLSIKSPV